MAKSKILTIFLIILLFVLVGCKEEIEEKSYTINFDSNTNETFETIKIDKPSSISLPIPSKKGYTFAGWYPSEDYTNGTIVNEQTIIGKDITLHAKWNPIEITLTLDLQGGYLENNDTEVKIYTNEFYQFPRAYLNEHIFLGWFVDDKEVNEKTEFLENTIVKAKFKALSELQKEYAITLNLDGGSYYSYDEIIDNNYRHLYNMNADWTSLNDAPVAFINLVSDFSYDYFVFNKELNNHIWNYNIDDLYKKINNSIVGSNGFCGSSNFYNKWIWLFEYLATTATSTNRPYFEALLNGEYENTSNSYGIEHDVICAELLGFFTRSQFKIVKNENLTITSADYSNEELLNGFLNYLNPTKYTTGLGLKLYTPYKQDFVFKGWYDNPDFTGEQITEIMHNDFGDKVYYAKWGK